MKNNTRSLKLSLNKLSFNYREKVKLLHNKYQHEDCYILTCGPSLKKYSEDFLYDFLKDKLVFTVKTAYNIGKLSEISDFHFFNCCNLPILNSNAEHYAYEDTISISSSNFEYGLRWSSFQKTDIFFKIPQVNPQTNMNDFIAINKHFDKFMLNKQFERPVGPGIMYETVIFTAVHLGVKNIITLGWDLSNTSIDNPNEYPHFYNKNQSMINRGTIMPWEIEATTAASKDLYLWLNKNNINMTIASENSALYNEIPRKLLK